jgi:indole-3-glycerol phosphate synthase/phosphoribosylanthranilate isomerase
MDLDPVQHAKKYCEAGAMNLSILTEQRYFNGSLTDLIAVAASDVSAALLRKDFIMHLDEIDVSYRSGADAVLLIARILPLQTLLALCRRSREYNMTPFVEIREIEDLDKLKEVLKDGPVIAGVNSRDLKSFQIDPMVPAMMREAIPCAAVAESGATSPQMCTYVRRLGYEGMLIGEAVSRNPEMASQFITAFGSAGENRCGKFWRKVGRKLTLVKNRPLVKICGITTVEDALLAAGCGADLLGCIYAPSPRSADRALAEQICDALEQRYGSNRPLVVTVITDLENSLAKHALMLAQRDLVDAIQIHHDQASQMIQLLDEQMENFGGIGRYGAIPLGSSADLVKEQLLFSLGEPRVLCDARVEGKTGGTGTMIPKELLIERTASIPMWLAGGLGPDTVRLMIEMVHPELIDASSQLESYPGKKDPYTMRTFFKEVLG